MMAIEMPHPDQGAWEFKVLGDVESDAWALFQFLYEKVRREMAVKHVELTEHGWHLTPGDRLVGRIEWDRDTDGATPVLVIDGRAFAREDVGRMLMSFEGFTLDAQIEDSIEPVGGPLAEKPDRDR